MAAIALTQVSLYPDDIDGEFYPRGKDDRGVITRRLKLTAVTANDTATATVLGFTTILDATGAFNATAGTPVPVTVGINPVTNLLHIGSGPSAETVYVNVTGTVK